MRKMLTFIPLGIAISSAIIYIINVIRFRVISNSTAMMQILANLRIYLYISIGSFLVYFFVKVLLVFTSKSKIKKETIMEEDYEPLKISEEDEKKLAYKEKKTVIKEIVITGNKYCQNCGEKIFDIDNYCKNCGTYQKDKKSGINPILKNIINLLEIVILILILYFSLNMLFEYKESKDSSFKSPFNINMTK